MDLAGYYGMVENLDQNLGRIRKSLMDLGVDRETYIVFFSDHGDMLRSHGQKAKSSPWEEAIRGQTGAMRSHYPRIRNR